MKSFCSHCLIRRLEGRDDNSNEQASRQSWHNRRELIGSSGVAWDKSGKPEEYKTVLADKPPRIFM